MANFHEMRKAKYGTANGRPPELPPVVLHSYELASDYQGLVVSSEFWRVAVVHRDFGYYVPFFYDPRGKVWKQYKQHFTRESLVSMLSVMSFKPPSPEFFDFVETLPNLPPELSTIKACMVL